MKLSIDIGNTSTKFGVFDGTELMKYYHMHTPKKKSDYTEVRMVLKEFLKIKDTEPRIGISSVVPLVDNSIRLLMLTAFKTKTLNVSSEVNLPININVRNKLSVGADRICNAVFGYEYFNRKENVLIIDTGSAVTYDLIKNTGDYEGGLIAPGINTLGLSLHMNTAKLPLIDFAVKSDSPKQFIGKNTESAIKSGVYYSFVDSMNGIIARFNEEMNGDLKVILTGGLTKIFYKDIVHDYDFIQNTVLHGINYIMMYNYGH
jgi:type III pantothenate kinase